MHIRLVLMQDHHKVRSCLLCCLILIALLAACSPQETLNPQATPTPKIISLKETIASLSEEQKIGSGNVEAVAWSPDGTILAIATSIQIDLYDAKTMTLNATLNHSNQWNQDLAFSADGKLLAASTERGKTEIWDVSQRRVVQTVADNDLVSQHGPKPALVFSNDGKKVFIGTDQTISVWDVSSGQMLDSFPGQTDGVTAMDISQDGKTLLAAGGSSIYVRDLTTGELLYPPIKLTEGTFVALFVALDGKHFITLHYTTNYDSSLPYQSQIRKWDLATGKSINMYDAAFDLIYDAHMSTDQGRIAIAGLKNISVWDTNKKANIFSSTEDGRSSSAILNPDGTQLLSITSAGVRLWDVEQHQVLKHFDEYNAFAAEAVFSPDGRLVAVVGNNRKIQVRSIPDNKLLYTFDGSFPLTFSKDGSILAFAQGREQEISFNEYSDNTSIKIVDTTTGKALPVEIPCQSASTIAISPDGGKIAYGGDRDCPLQLRDLHSGFVLQTLSKEDYGNPENTTFSPNGDMVFYIGNNTIKIWDIQNGSLVKTVTGLQFGAKLALSADGRFLAISAFQGEYPRSLVKIWDLKNGQQVFSVETLQSEIQALAFNPSSNILAISGGINAQGRSQVEFWDSWNGKPIGSLELPAKALAISFSPDGKSFLSAEESDAIRSWKPLSSTSLVSSNLPTPTLAPTAKATIPVPELQISKIADLGKGFISHLFRSADNKFMAYYEGTSLKWYETASMTELGSVDTDIDFYSQLIFSPDDNLIIAEDYYGAQIIDLVSKRVVGKISGGRGGTSGYTFTKDGRYMAYLGGYSTGALYRSIGLWDIVRHKSAFDDEDYFPTLQNDRPHTMSGPAISPNGNLVAAGHSDHRVYIWDLHSGETRFILEGHADEVTSVDFSPNGQFLASGSADGTIRLWNPINGKLIRVLTGFLYGIRAIKFSPDGRSLLVNTVGDETTQIYDLQTNRITAAVTAQPTTDPLELQQYQQGYTTGFINDLLFSPDGNSVLLAGEGLWLWDAHNAKLLRYIDISAWGDLSSVVFSANSKYLVLKTQTARLLILDAQSGQPVLILQGKPVGKALVYEALPPDADLTESDKQRDYEKALAVSPAGALLAFANATKIEVWNTDTANKVWSLDTQQESASIGQLSFSKDGKQLFAELYTRSRNFIQVWDMESGRMRHQTDLPETFNASVLHAPFDVGSNSDGMNSWIELFNIETGQSLRLETPSTLREPLSFSPDGSILLGVITTNNNGSSKYELFFWKTSNGAFIGKTEADFLSYDLSISPDNKSLAMSANNNTGQLWDISQIALAAQATESVSDIPQALATPALISWPSATPQPTQTLTTQPESPVQNAISPSNAGKIKQLSRFGQGTVERANWSPSGTSILAASSLGSFQYNQQLVETSHLEMDGVTYHTISLPDERILSASVNAGHVLVRDITNAQILADLEGSGEPVISPDGTLLVYQDEEKNLRVWDLENKQVISILYNDSVSSNDYWRWPEFSADGKLITALQYNDWSQDYYNAARVWDARSGVIVNALGGPDSAITNLSFSADGRFMVGAAGGSAWIWSTQAGAPVDSINVYKPTTQGNLDVYDHTVTAAGISPDDRVIAVGTSERVIWLYNRQDHSVLRELDGHNAALKHLRFSPDGKSLLAVDEDGVIQIWDTASGKATTSVKTHIGAIGGMVFRTDNNLTAWQAGSAQVLNPANGELLQTTDVHGGTILAASPAGDWLAVYDPYHISLWDARNGTFKRTLEGEAEEGLYDYDFRRMIPREFYTAAFSSDGSQLATGGSGGIWLYDMQNDGRLLQQISGPAARKLAFSPDNRALLTPLYYGMSLEFLELQTGKSLFSLDGYFPYAKYQQFAFSPDGHWVGNLFINEDEDIQLSLWDVTTQKLAREITFGKETPIISLAFNPAASLIALGQGDGKIILLRLSDFTTVATLTGHRKDVDHLTFSPDGQYLASTSQDGTLRIWGIP